MDRPVVAQKLFYENKLNEFNMTEMRLIREPVSAAGVGAELYWFHDLGYFEEFLGHKSGKCLTRTKSLGPRVLTVTDFNAI